MACKRIDKKIRKKKIRFYEKDLRDYSSNMNDKNIEIKYLKKIDLIQKYNKYYYDKDISQSFQIK